MPNRLLGLRLAVTATLLVGLVGLATPASPDAATSLPTAPFTRWERQAYYAPMDDGVQLAVTLYLPAGGEATTRFPVLLWYLPGHRESIDPATGRLIPAYAEDELRFFTSQGYALAVAEMRGSGASFGSRELDRGPRIGRDGKQLVDWIASQPWSDGRVGMVGASYQGFSQYATAAERPAALRAIFPEIAGFDDYTSMFNPGGIPNIALSAFATASIVRDDLNHYDPRDARARYPSAPVVDEDGDGDLSDEIPIDRNGDGSFLDDGPPRYKDGKARQDLYYRATLAHQQNSNLSLESLAAAPYRDSKVGGTAYDYRAIDPADRAQRIAASGIAVYNRGGWFDYHARDTVMWHATLAGHTPSHLMMAPTGHGSFPATDADELYRAGPYFKLFDDHVTTKRMLNREKLRFFDHYLRGIDNGFEREAPVKLYVMGLGWRDEQTWPLARERRVAWRPDAGGRLGTGRVAHGEDHYTVDTQADSLSKGANRWNYGISSAREPMTLDAPVDRRLHYTSAALDVDTEVTGHPVLTLTLSSTQSNGDLYAYLEDVAPDGRSLLVTEGELRLNYARLLPVQDIAGVAKSVITVKPDLPWHGYARKDYVGDPLKGGRRLTVTLDLLPTAWVFKAGHRLRLSLAGADAPSFALHPAQGPSQHWTIHRGAGLSELVLPVIPAAERTKAVQR